MKTRELRTNGRTVKLQEQPFQVLTSLLERPGQLTTRAELKERLWPSGTFVDFGHSLNKAVNRLREALEDSAGQPIYIETIPRRGYRFIAPVVPETAVHDDVIPHALALRPSRWRRTVAAAVVIIIVGVAALITHQTVLFQETTSSHPVIHSLAVLPLESLSPDHDQDYFADGLTDELITELGQVHELRVISRNSIMPYKGERKSLREIARDLKVDAIVEGTVVRSGNQVRVTAQLIQVPADRHLWARSYSGNLQQVLALQDSIALDIASQIKIRLTDTEQARFKHPQTSSSEANEAYFQGRYYWEKRGISGNAQTAIRYFQQAIHDDPHFAAAWSALAESYAIAPDYSSARPYSSYDKAEDAARRALELDSRSAEAHTALALMAASKDFDWRRAESEFRIALELNPGYSNAHHWHAFNLVALNKFDDAIAEINQARELDPLSPIVNANVGFILYLTGDWDHAIEIERKYLRLDPNNPDAHRYLGLALLRKLKYGEALTHLRKAVDLSGGYAEYVAELSYAYAAEGDRDYARTVLTDLERSSQRTYVPAFSLAVAYAGLGNRGASLKWLRSAIDDRCDLVPTLNTNPLFAQFHDDSRFNEMLHRIGLDQETGAQ